MNHEADDLTGFYRKFNYEDYDVLDAKLFVCVNVATNVNNFEKFEALKQKCKADSVLLKQAGRIGSRNIKSSVRHYLNFAECFLEYISVLEGSPYFLRSADDFPKSSLQDFQEFTKTENSKSFNVLEQSRIGQALTAIFEAAAHVDLLTLNSWKPPSYWRPAKQNWVWRPPAVETRHGFNGCSGKCKACFNQLNKTKFFCMIGMIVPGIIYALKDTDTSSNTVILGAITPRAIKSARLVLGNLEVKLMCSTSLIDPAIYEWSSRFYSLVPHHFEESVNMPLLDTAAKVAEKRELLDELEKNPPQLLLRNQERLHESERAYNQTLKSL